MCQERVTRLIKKFPGPVCKLDFAQNGGFFKLPPQNMVLFAGKRGSTPFSAIKQAPFFCRNQRAGPKTWAHLVGHPPLARFYNPQPGRGLLPYLPKF
jgi:hypothetical protein